jgi:hypothetical protein
LSRAEDLERLARLLDEGKISQEEFAELKKEILSPPVEASAPRRERRSETATGESVGKHSSGEQSKTGMGCAVVILIAIGIWIFSSLGGGSSDGGNSGGLSEVAAYTACQEFVEDRLVAPSTAKFGGGPSQVTDSLGGSRYEVATYVDAENSFGAMIRNNFTCVVERTGDTYRLESLEMQG